MKTGAHFCNLGFTSLAGFNDLSLVFVLEKFSLNDARQTSPALMKIGVRRKTRSSELKHSPLDLTLPTRGPCIYCSSEHNSKVFGKVKIELNSAIYDLQAWRGLTTIRDFSVFGILTSRLPLKLVQR